MNSSFLFEFTPLIVVIVLFKVHLLILCPTTWREQEVLVYELP